MEDVPSWQARPPQVGEVDIHLGADVYWRINCYTKVNKLIQPALQMAG
jgi:hypothetical protein